MADDSGLYTAGLMTPVNRLVSRWLSALISN